MKAFTSPIQLPYSPFRLDCFHHFGRTIGENLERGETGPFWPAFHCYVDGEGSVRFLLTV